MFFTLSYFFVKLNILIVPEKPFLTFYKIAYGTPDDLVEDIECYGNNLKEKGDNIALLAKRNGLERAWYIGDIQGDYDATMKAGLEFIHAAYGFGKIEQKTLKLRKFSELPELIDCIIKNG